MNLGCIGCGFIAGIHAANIGRLEGARLVHVCDVREAVAQSFAGRFGAQAWSTDPAAVFADPNVEAVLVCTHPDTHAELATSTARAGKHVFVEKPLATTTEGCRQILAEVSAAGVTLAVDLKFRFAKAVAAVRAAVPNPVFLVGQSAMDPLPDDSPHMDPAVGGGLVANLGSHLFDLLCTFAHRQPEWVFASGLRLPGRSRTRFDAVTGTLAFSGDCLASFTIADTGEWPTSSKWFYEVADGSSTAVISGHGRRAIIVSATGEETVEELEVPPHEVGALATLTDFVSAASSGRRPVCSGEDGLRAVAVGAAVDESIRRAVPVPVET